MSRNKAATTNKASRRGEIKFKVYRGKRGVCFFLLVLVLALIKLGQLREYNHSGEVTTGVSCSGPRF